MRLRGYDEELETYTNDVQVLNGEIANLTKTAKTPSGISIFADDAKTEYKSTLQILRDINEIYDDLDDKTQAQLLEKIAGKRQGQIVAATLNNWDTVEKALEAMDNADGSAMREMEVIMDSVSYKANEVKETIVGIAQDTITQDFLKSVLESVTRILNVISDSSSPIKYILNQVANLLELVTKLTDKIGLLPTMLGSLALKSTGIFNTLGTGLGNFINKSFESTIKDFTLSGKNIASTLFKDSDTIALQKFNQELKNGVTWRTAYNNTMIGTSEQAQKNAQQYTILEARLKKYDTQLKANKIDQQEYNTRVDATKAKMASLGVETQALTIKERALAIATKAMSTAFQIAKVVLATFAINLAITALTKFVNKQKELTEQAKKSAEETREQIKSLDELKKKYIEIVDSTDSERSKNEQLNAIKQELIETYKIEKEHLEGLNLERENGIALLEEEIALKSQEERGNWLGSNKEAFDRAKGRINNTNYDKATDGTIQSDVFKRINKEDVRDSVKDLFSNIYDLGAEGNTYFEIAGDTLIEKYENLQKIIAKLGNSKDLTQSEQNLLDGLNKESEAIKKILDENQETYETGYKFTAENYFADYVNNNKVEDVGKETYLAWRNGLIATADGDKTLEENLLNLAEEQFPDYAKYFNNLNLAKSKFGISDTINSATEGMKLAFINSLDDADLDILVNKIEDPFKNGIEGAEKEIEDFKADPNNKVSVETDTKSIDDMLKAVEDYSESANTYVKNQKTVSGALKEQADYGKLASSTIIELTDAGYASALVYDKETGAITLNKQAVENLNAQKQSELKFDLIKEKSEIEQKYKDEATAVGELQREMATANETRREAIRLEIAEKSKNMAEYYEMISQYNGLIGSIDNYTPDNNGGKANENKPKSAQDFETELARRQHEINMGRMQEDEAYYNWLLSAAHTAYDGLADYQDELWKHEEEVYKWRQEQEQKLFDKKIDNLEKLADKALDDYKDGNGNELTATASFDYAREQINSAIAETKARIDGIRNGTISGNTDDIERLINDLESLNNKLIDINKKEIESEKGYISELKNDYIDMMDERIDKADELSDKIEESYDRQIDAIDKQIDELEKIKDAEDRIKKIKDAQLAVKEKEKALDEAKREDAKNNYVYFDGTGMSVQTSNENQEKAQEELEEAYRDEQINVLKDQKDILEKQKDEAKDYYDNIKDNLEKQKTQGEKTYEAVEKIYEQLNSNKKQNSFNTELVKKLSESGDISKAISELSDTDRQKVIDAGVIKVQPNGDYTFNYSVFEKYSNAVDNNALATQNLTSILKDIVLETEAQNKNKPDNSIISGGFNLVADLETGKLTKKQVIINDKVVDGLGHKVNAVSKEEWQEHNNKEKVNKGSFAGYNTFIDFMRAVSAGKVNIKPFTGLLNSSYNPVIDKMNKSMSDTINNVSNNNVNNVNNKPVIQQTINIDGNADEKTITAFKSIMEDKFCDYTDKITQAVNRSFAKQN